MKPEQFIREFGEKKAREVVEGAPKIGSYWQEYGADNGTYYGYDSFYGAWYEYWDIPNAPMWQKVFTKECFSFNRVEVKDLKRLVESVDLVNSLGGLKAARSEAHKDCFAYNQSLLAAIAAYESIYGGGDE